MAVKWGIVSTAHINRAFLAGARQADDTEILAVASRDQTRADEYARENQIERAYGSYEAILHDPDVEAVYISLPNSLHIEWTKKALEAGKHVLCEKPLSRRAKDVEDAFDVAERNDRLLMEAFMYRHNPQTRRVKELASNGAVGRIRMIRAGFGYVAPDPEDVRLSTELEGGALMDVGCYCVSAARLIAGEPERVAGEQALGGQDDAVDVAFAGILRFADDITAHFDAGLALATNELLEVVGDAGMIRLTDPWHCRNPGIDLIREGETERIETPLVNSYRLEAENMSAAIRGEAALLLGRADAIGQARTIEALYEAADNGRTVILSS